jgi:hypothetical protein
MIPTRLIAENPVIGLSPVESVELSYDGRLETRHQNEQAINDVAQPVRHFLPGCFFWIIFEVD